MPEQKLCLLYHSSKGISLPTFLHRADLPCSAVDGCRSSSGWANRKQTDAFFFDHPEIADRYGFVTCCQGEPIGFICWNPRNRPEYVKIGHNGIRTAHKGKGFGKAQLKEALRRIRAYEGLKEIRVCTNDQLIAPRNYESAGFVLYDRKENHDEAPFAGDYLYYRIRLL